MAKAAKAPAKKSSLPLLLGAGVLLIGVVYMTQGSGDSTAATTTRKAKKTSSKDMGVITQADLDAQKHPFPPATLASVDAFNPAIKTTIKQVKLPILPAAGAAQQIDPAFTGGEANWYFTGCPELDGQKQALLENTTTGDSVYVRPGDAFKDSRIASIDVATVVLVGKAGKSLDVPIVAYGDVPGGGKGPVAVNGPLTLPPGTLSGPIGVGRLGVQPATGPSSITLNDGSTMQLPGTGASGNNDNTGRRRRGRRNNGNSDNGS